MKPSENKIENQLKDAVQLSGAAWAVVAERASGSWKLRAVHSLPRSAHSAFTATLSKPAVDAWLCGSLTGGYSRSSSLPDFAKFGASKLFVYPITGASQAIIVGAAKQNAEGQKLWRLVASLFASHATGADSYSFLSYLQMGLAYETPVALDKVLNSFAQTASFQGAWLAIRRGELLDIQAEWNDPTSLGLSLPIESMPILRRLNRSLSDVALRREESNWAEIPHTAFKSNTKFWACLPLVIGHRLIGAVAMWRAKEFSNVEWRELRDLAARVAPSVEVIVTFSEMTGHLRRLAMLNDFVMTVSSAQNLDQIARRVFGLLARAFGTELIALYLLSTDGRLLRDYRTLDGKVNAMSVAATEHPIFPLLKEGNLKRMNDDSTGFSPIHAEARSALIVPLKYRGQTIGVLSIESPRPEAFSQYDENLMVVIASHLAGLIEYGRLREEAEGRARSLSLIHEVVQQVIGLTDKSEVAQITADLLAQYFKYELAAVLLLDNESKPSTLGIGGSRAETVLRGLEGSELTIDDGITGRVLKTGQSILVNDTSLDQNYKPLKGWDAGAEICVAILGNDRMLGIIDVESSRHNSFTQNDLLALESLAGILASVISSADQYQRLQELVRQLRATEMELLARMEAQREAEQKLIQAAKLAAVGEMAAGIAHELNNPLTTVTGFAELILLELTENGSENQELEIILREARRASDVVRRLLDFSRQGELTRTRADLNEIVEDVLALTRHLIRTKGVLLTVDLAKNLQWVSVDRNQMKQVLLNLIHNSLQAMSSGGKLTVATEARNRDDREWITMSVRDSGVGIAPKDKDRIFEPFFTTKGEKGGTGLGLSVTYGIVTDHGGTIEVESELGQGSLFTVWLPL